MNISERGKQKLREYQKMYCKAKKMSLSKILIFDNQSMNMIIWNLIINQSQILVILKLKKMHFAPIYLTDINEVNISQIMISSKVSYGKKGFKYFILWRMMIKVNHCA